MNTGWMRSGNYESPLSRPVRPEGGADYLLTTDSIRSEPASKAGRGRRLLVDHRFDQIDDGIDGILLV